MGAGASIKTTTADVKTWTPKQLAGAMIADLSLVAYKYEHDSIISVGVDGKMIYDHMMDTTKFDNLGERAEAFLMKLNPAMDALKVFVLKDKVIGLFSESKNQVCFGWKPQSGMDILRGFRHVRLFSVPENRIEYNMNAGALTDSDKTTSSLSDMSTSFAASVGLSASYNSLGALFSGSMSASFDSVQGSSKSSYLRMRKLKHRTTSVTIPGEYRKTSKEALDLLDGDTDPASVINQLGYFYPLVVHYGGSVTLTSATDSAKFEDKKSFNVSTDIAAETAVGGAKANASVSGSKSGLAENDETKTQVYAFGGDLGIFDSKNPDPWRASVKSENSTVIEIEMEPIYKLCTKPERAKAIKKAMETMAEESVSAMKIAEKHEKEIRENEVVKAQHEAAEKKRKDEEKGKKDKEKGMPMGNKYLRNVKSSRYLKCSSGGHISAAIPKDAYTRWKIEKVGDEFFSLKNAATGRYLRGTPPGAFASGYVESLSKRNEWECWRFEHNEAAGEGKNGEKCYWVKSSSSENLGAWPDSSSVYLDGNYASWEQWWLAMDD